MTDATLEREALALFEALLDLPEAERDAFLAARTEGNPELAARVAAMQEADRRASLGTGGAIEELDEEIPPERIGAYRIAERIGRGGMGSVYRGERMTGDFAHVVAIKIIKPGLLSEALVERFIRERQTLASLTHPNIAQLYDGGETETGSPYIVMEHVAGLPLLQWIEERKPDRTARLKLFGDICGAVAFANRNLVVHRDLTPSNVLVAGDGTVKLIDFGIAKPVSETVRGDAAEASVAGLSLTPGYAAPERMVSAAVTTAADVYSLGKLLAKIMAPEARNRELAAIVAKATAENPLERYATADAMGDDVAAWQSGRPVAAIGGGRGYAVRKFVARNTLMVGAAALALALLVGALVLTLSAYSRAETARIAEAARFDDLRSLARFMVLDLNPQLARTPGNTAARARLVGEAQTYLTALAGSAQADDALKLEAAQGLIALARAQGVPTQPNLGERDKAKANIAAALDLLRGLAGHVVTGPDLSMALLSRAMIEAHGDADTDAAVKTLAEATSALESTPAEARDLRWRMARSRLSQAELEVAVLSQDTDGLARLTDRIEAEAAEWPDDEDGRWEADFNRANAFYYRAVHGYFTDALQEAVANAGRAEAVFARMDVARPNDPEALFARAWNAYTGYGAASGLDDGAALAATFLEVARSISDRLLAMEANDNAIRSFAANIRQAQAEALSRAGEFIAAIAVQREVIGLREAALGPERNAGTLNKLVGSHVVLGNIAIAAGDAGLACEAHRNARAIMRELESREALLGSMERFREGLDANLAVCDAGGPVDAMKTL